MALTNSSLYANCFKKPDNLNEHVINKVEKLSTAFDNLKSKAASFNEKRYCRHSKRDGKSQE